ncbi:MAG: multiprotein bridging factor aMBF1 [Halobacteria archaeon]
MQCEMCGTETGELTVIQTEGSKLEVCGNCTDFGTVLHDETPSRQEKEEEKKDQGAGKKQPTTTKSPPSGGGGGKSSFDEMETLAPDYDERVRQARENNDLTQKELSDRLNEKVSLIRKIELGDMRPSEEVREELEHELGVSLTEEVEAEEWETEDGSDGYTLGDIIERKD